MAEGLEDTERSEDPTQKRLDEAVERGDVAKSQEVNTWFVIAGGTLVLMAFSGSMATGITTTLRGLVANSWAIRVDGRGFLDVIGSMAAGSVRTRPSRRDRSGHSSAAMMAPISASLARPLMKFASACLEKRRLKPASGEILESFGLSGSPDQTKRC